ncbi:hypothetical protein B0H17DRAFT_345093 [Mycena rosella]|uniref:Uncharacterized protein n=1 Tax=Mycena rosella TaxID=1033263 RepID=A0AAD7CQR7_MYCRO|nr:hypothetical protein B0H17DRAFT_345093 [Mycena rosella]
MVDILYVALTICVLASNIRRLQSLFRWLYSCLLRARNPVLVPYFDQEGVLIGMVRLDPVTHRLPRPDTRPTVRAEADTPLHRGE